MFKRSEEAIEILDQNECDKPEEKKQKIMNVNNETLAIKTDCKEKVTEKERKSEDSFKKYKVSESSVHITEYVNTGFGFDGDLKQRYTDFIVHELDEHGNLVELTTLTPPNIEEEKNEILTCDLISEEQKQQIQKLQLSKKPENDKLEENSLPIHIVVTNLEKESRTLIHRYLKQFDELQCDTKEVNDIRVIEVRKGKSKRRECRWPAERPAYVHFTMYQENKGTFEAINVLSKYLHLNAKSFAYAGTKDKRASSSQRVSLYKVPAQRLEQLCKGTLKHECPIGLGNYTYLPQPLRLGQSSGNRFELVLRDVRFQCEQYVHESISKLQTDGFLNYFGTQRFGMRDFPTHKVGALMLRKLWKQAVMLILSERTVDITPHTGRGQKSAMSFNECIREFNVTGDAASVYQKFFWKQQNEGLILRGLSKQPQNYASALHQLPRNNRIFYMHSYQSYIWNALASYRLRKFGFQLIEGDLVTQDSVFKNDLTEDEPRHTTNVQLVTKENILQFSIFDMVLPLPGCDVQYPLNEVGKELERLLLEDEVQLSDFASSCKADALYGTYRKVIIRPQKLKYELLKYKDATQRLYETDLDRILQRQLTFQQEGDKWALKLRFELPSSSYATVCVRELLKQDLINDCA